MENKENKETKTEVKRERIKIDVTSFTKVTAIPEIVRGGEAKTSVLKLAKEMIKGEIRKYSFKTIKEQRTLASRVYKYGSDKEVNLESSVRIDNGLFLVFIKKV